MYARLYSQISACSEDLICICGQYYLRVDKLFRSQCSIVQNTKPAARDFHPRLIQCWAIVADGGPTLNRYLVNVSCLLGNNENAPIKLYDNYPNCIHFLAHPAFRPKMSLCHRVASVVSRLCNNSQEMLLLPQFFSDFNYVRFV